MFSISAPMINSLELKGTLIVCIIGIASKQRLNGNVVMCFNKSFSKCCSTSGSVHRDFMTFHVNTSH